MDIQTRLQEERLQKLVLKMTRVICRQDIDLLKTIEEMVSGTGFKGALEMVSTWFIDLYSIDTNDEDSVSMVDHLSKQILITMGNVHEKD